jgi:hypothetical protein
MVKKFPTVILLKSSTNMNAIKPDVVLIPLDAWFKFESFMVVPVCSYVGCVYSTRGIKRTVLSQGAVWLKRCSSAVLIEHTGSLNYQIKFHESNCYISRFRSSHLLMRGSAATRLLGLWVRIPPGAWISGCCDCCVLPAKLSVWRASQSSRGVILCVCVCVCVYVCVCWSEISKPLQWESLCPLGLSNHE